MPPHLLQDAINDTMVYALQSEFVLGKIKELDRASEERLDEVLRGHYLRKRLSGSVPQPSPSDFSTPLAKGSAQSPTERLAIRRALAAAAAHESEIDAAIRAMVASDNDPAKPLDRTCRLLYDGDWTKLSMAVRAASKVQFVQTKTIYARRKKILQLVAAHLPGSWPLWLNQPRPTLQR